MDPLAFAKMYPDIQLWNSCKVNDFFLLGSLKTSGKNYIGYINREHSCISNGFLSKPGRLQNLSMILFEYFGEFIRRNQNSREEWVGWLASGEPFLCTQITKFLQPISTEILLGLCFVLGTGDAVLDMVGNNHGW